MGRWAKLVATEQLDMVRGSNIISASGRFILHYVALCGSVADVRSWEARISRRSRSFFQYHAALTNFSDNNLPSEEEERKQQWNSCNAWDS